MKLEELQKITKKGESHVLEFKSSTANLKEAFQTICGMLNNKGGKVLIGVDDSGVIRGQEIGDSTKKHIAEHIKKIEPAANMDVEYIKLEENKYVIVLEVFDDQNIQQPYVYDGRPYLRTESVTSIMKQTKYHEMLSRKVSCFSVWESQPSVYDFSAKVLKEVLDDDTIHKQFIERGIQYERMPVAALHTPLLTLFTKLELVYESLGKKKLKHAALVLFGRNVEEKGYPQCSLKLARFKGTTKTLGFIDEKHVYGNAFSILNQAESFIKSYMPISGSFSENSFLRKDEPAVPRMAIREALVNAICHREYNNPIGEIAVAIYDDRLTVWSRGELPKALTLKKLTQEHNSCPRNRLISEIFYKAGYIEKWGSGTLRIIDICKEQGVPKPIYSEHTGGFSVEFKFKSTAVTERVIKKSAPVDISEIFSRLTVRQRKILEIIKELGGEVQSKDIVEHIEIPGRSLQRELRNLSELNLVTSTGSGRSTFWKIAASIDEKLGNS